MRRRNQNHQFLIIAVLTICCVTTAGVRADWLEQQKLTAGDADNYDYFGYSVSIDGDYAIVGARYDDEKAFNAGAAYIFKLVGGTWTQQGKLTASDGQTLDMFGFSVSISSDYAIVGAPSHNSHTGAAYIFKRSGTDWSQQAKLTASDGAINDEFGYSVSISGDCAIAGAYGDDNFLGNDSGSAYIFEKPPGGWINANETTKIFAFDGVAGDRFGYSVSNSGNFAVVGAEWADLWVGGPLYDAGAAYLFERTGPATIVPLIKFTASNASAGDWFGCSVSIKGNEIIVGATGKDLPGKGQVGAAYIYKFSPTEFVEQANIMASDPDASDYFGWSVSISGDYALVGAFGDSEGGTSAGAAYIFRWDQYNNNWSELQKLLATGAAEYESFGASVSMDDDYAIIGAYGDDNIGSAFVYRQICPSADLSGNCIVNFVDFAHFALWWQAKHCADPEWCGGADFDQSTMVDFEDLLTFCSQWLDYN
jgi:hypothetical protein